MTITATAPRTFRPSEEIELEKLDAMRVALLAFSQPLKLSSNTKSPAPGMLAVIKAAAGDGATLQYAAATLGHDGATIQEAASFFLQQQLLRTRQNPFQQLGLTDNAGLDDIMLHKRWLLKWLHPDRNTNKWQSAMFQSVTDAASSAAALKVPGQNAAAPQNPHHLGAADHKNRAKDVGSHTRSSRATKHKRIRIIRWRDVFRRIVRRLVMASVLLPLIYFGVTHVVKNGSKWSSDIQNLLTQ